MDKFVGGLSDHACSHHFPGRTLRLQKKATTVIPDRLRIDPQKVVRLISRISCQLMSNTTKVYLYSLYKRYKGLWTTRKPTNTPGRGGPHCNLYPNIEQDQCYLPIANP